MTVDIGFRNNGIFVQFYAESEAGKVAWNELAERSEGTAKFPSPWLPSICEQLEAAGYVVKMARRHRISDEQLLAELYSNKRGIRHA
jgi:hypothetical protein